VFVIWWRDYTKTSHQSARGSLDCGAFAGALRCAELVDVGESHGVRRFAEDTQRRGVVFFDDEVRELAGTRRPRVDMIIALERRQPTSGVDVATSLADVLNTPHVAVLHDDQRDL